MTRSEATPNRVIASAPGRVNLVGEHTDYNGGPVLPVAIDRRTTIRVTATPGRTLTRVRSTSYQDAGLFKASSTVPSGHWSSYVAGVAAGLRRAGLAVPDVDIEIASDVPTGAGLSSSAALEVATAFALARLVGRTITPLEAARVGHWVETEFVGVRSGIMDQFASALGRAGEALYLHCDTEAYRFVPFRDPILIVDSGVPRTLAGSAFNRRREECDAALARLRETDPALSSLAAAPASLLDAVRLPEPLRRRARHVITETARVHMVAAALTAGGRFPADLLLASHRSLRDDFECSCTELDWLVDYLCAQDGVSGARLTGAGWGGCVIALGDGEALEQLQSRLVYDYAERLDRRARTWLTRASEGARIDL